jgi:hypothetical protein
MKKTYRSPRLTSHGNAVALTRGPFGFLLEFINWRIG